MRSRRSARGLLVHLQNLNAVSNTAVSQRAEMWTLDGTSTVSAASFTTFLVCVCYYKIF